MPRRPRLAAGDLAYHVLNRRVGRLPLFEKPADYVAFEKVLAEAHAQTGIRIAAYCLMPNHWHLLLWPKQDGELSEVLRWITVTHTQRWHAHHHTAGTGPVYQGRFKSFPVQTDEHFLAVARYVERNARRARLVSWAEDWQWSRGWRRQPSCGPMGRPPDMSLSVWITVCAKPPSARGLLYCRNISSPRTWVIQVIVIQRNRPNKPDRPNEQEPRRGLLFGLGGHGFNHLSRELFRDIL